MSQHELINTLVLEGWTVEFEGTLEDARKHVQSHYDWTRHEAMCYRGSTRQAMKQPWIDQVARVTVWAANPEIEDRSLSTHSRRIVLMQDQRGAIVRKLSWASGTTTWINPNNAEVSASVLRNGVTGKAQRQQRAAEQAVKNHERNETIERHTRLLEDARDLMERIGHQREDLSMTLHGNNSNVFVDIEVLLDVLRQAAFEKEQQWV